MDPSPNRESISAAAPLLARYAAVRAATERLTAPLEIEDYGLQSMPDASPAKWHLAHTSWFFETFVLLPAGAPPFDPAYAYLWNSYYDAVGPRHPRPQRGLLSRPTVREVLEYRAHVDAEIRARFPELDARGRSALELGLHHEQQHQELLLTDLKHAFFQNPLRPAYAPPSERDPHAAPALSWIRFDEGLRWVGQRGHDFAFDNEGPAHRVWLDPFVLANRPATCGEYLAFMDDGGYRRPELWLSDGWALAQSAGWDAPLYWDRFDDGWRMFTLHGMQPLDPAEPVCHLSFYEADAFARWSGARLPTEFEWEVAATGACVRGNLAECGRLHPEPSRPQEGEDACSLFGDVWEWTASAYAPYPGYRPEGGALGEYNGKFMSGQMVLRGGSFATPARHIRASYRNFWPPATRFQFAGVRLAR